MQSNRAARVVMTLWVGAVVACVSPRPSVDKVSVAPQVIKSRDRFRKEYVFAPGDSLEVYVRDHPEASRTVVVRPDGFITIPLARDVQAAGLTPMEVTDKLTAALLARGVRSPDVTVIAAAVRQPSVYVIGDVNNNAAVVPLRDAPTVIQAVTLAGGLRRTAATGDIAIIRLGADGYLRAMPIETKVKGQPSVYMAMSTTLLQADDVIFVPESGRGQIARMLEDYVNRPLLGVNSILGLYVNYRLIRTLK